MRVVVDASAIGALLLKDETGALAAVTESLFAEDELHAPVHWPIEVVSLVVKAERNGRVEASAIEPLWNDATELMQLVDIGPPSIPRRIFALARSHGLSAQDAAYLDLALTVDAGLATGDKRLARACRAVSVSLPFDPLA